MAVPVTFAGIVGGVVSATGLNAAARIVQGAFAVAVALFAPAAPGNLSSPRLLSNVDLAVNPVPLVHEESETQKPNKRSPSTVATMGPLETLEDVPLAWALPSSGPVSATPL